MRLWDFAVRIWRRPGVETLCLELQEVHGQVPVLLLWRLWTLAESRPTGPEAIAAAIRAVRAWQEAVITPLRAARRALKVPPEGFDAAACAALREQTFGAELAAERLLLETLERLAPAAQGGAAGAALPAGRTAALSELIGAWGPPPPAALIVRLTQLI